MEGTLSEINNQFCRQVNKGSLELIGNIAVTKQLLQESRQVVLHVSLVYTRLRLEEIKRLGSERNESSDREWTE